MTESRVTPALVVILVAAAAAIVIVMPTIGRMRWQQNRGSLAEAMLRRDGVRVVDVVEVRGAAVLSRGIGHALENIKIPRQHREDRTYINATPPRQGRPISETHFTVLPNTPLIPAPGLAPPGIRALEHHGRGPQLADLELRVPAPLPRIHVIDPADLLHARDLARGAHGIRVEQIDFTAVLVEVRAAAVAARALLSTEPEDARCDGDRHERAHYHDAHDQWRRDARAGRRVGVRRHWDW